MTKEAAVSPVLFWPRKIRDASLYQTARRLICDAGGTMPATASDDLDMNEFFKKKPKATLYYPVMMDSKGWWGELLGGNAKVSGKIIVSPECQLMAIRAQEEPKPAANELYAAEIFPTSAFFKKMNSGIATILDMLATDSGTILALFSGRNQKKFMHAIESTGNMFLGTIGGY